MEQSGSNLVGCYGIGWSQASDFCKSIGGLLPTEEQWEFAARGVARQTLPWGTDAIDLARTL